MRKPIFFPAPKTLIFGDGVLDLSNGLVIKGNTLSIRAQQKLSSVLRDFSIIKKQNAKQLCFSLDNSLRPQQYKLRVRSNSVEIVHRDEQGAFYGAITFAQSVRQTSPRLPCFEIDDYPDFRDRGLMLDISRNKVPKLSTLKRLVDFLAQIKINQFQLYIEGLSFHYKSFANYYKKGSDFLTAEDIVSLDKYCMDNFIELVPNQNSFGHFAEWLSKDELKHLAELPAAFLYEGTTEMLPSTLNPLLEESVEFVGKLCKDLLPNFSSDKINVCGDEPFELGLGASKAECEKKGKSAVYLEFMNKVFGEARKYNKHKIMLFGDVIKNYPDCIKDLPEDVIALEWGYNDNSFNDEICRLYADSGIEYYVCPGTSMWNTVAGKSDFMLANIRGAAHYGFKHGARGLLNTDWGDGGTCQQYGLTLFPYSAGAAYSWNSQEDQDALICEYLDTFVYSDEEGKAARLVYDLGNYYKMQDSPDFNATKIFKILYVQQTDHINFGTNFEPLFKIKDRKMLSAEEYKRTKDYLDDIFTRAQSLILKCGDGALIKDEILWSVKYLIHGCELGLFITDYNSQKEENLHKLRADIATLLSQYKLIWGLRNKKSSLKWSILRMKSLLNKYEALLKSINHD